MSQSKLTVLHQALFETPPNKLLDWIEQEFNKYHNGKPTLFDRGKGKDERLNIYLERDSNKSLSIFTHKIISSKQKVIKSSNKIEIIDFTMDEQAQNRWKLSMRGLEKHPKILELAENIWKQVDNKFEPVSNDFVDEKKLQQKYKNVILLDGVYNIDPASLEDIVQDFLLFEKADSFKGLGLKIQKESRGNRQVQFRFMLDYFLNFGYIGVVVAQPLNQTTTSVKVSYGGVFPFSEYRDEIYQTSGVFFRSLVNHLLKLFGQQDFQQKSRNTMVKEPEASASREDWFLYKYQCDKRGKKFTHKELANKINISPGWTRTLYLRWKKLQ